MAQPERKVTVANFWDDEAEARAIGEEIENLQRANEPLNDMAVLVRASSQMRAIEDRFITLGLPYRVIGGPRFYERQEIKDAIAYLDIVANPANDLKFERIVNVPKRGLGDTTIKRIHELARARGHAAVSGGPRDRRNGRTVAEGPQISDRSHRRRSSAGAAISTTCAILNSPN